MKQLGLTVFVLLVFAAGLVLGLGLKGDPAPARGVGPAAVAQAPAPAASAPVQLELGPGQAGAAASPGAASGGETGPAAPAAGSPAAPGRDDPPPAAPPPPPPPAAQEEARRVSAEQAAAGEEGNGSVHHLVYEFESEAERQEWEQQRRANWERRLAREQDIKIKIMREQMGLSPAQEGRLREILAAELAERMRLVDAMDRQELSRSSFDEGVKANLAAARLALQQLLTPEQYQRYQELKPREQVLREETH